MLMRFIGKRVPLLLPLLVLASPARGQEETIVDVKVEGNRKIEKGVILNALRSRAGDPLSPEKVDADIRAVHRLGYFRDVWVSSDKVAGGVNLVVHVSEMPVVREIKIEGNKEISADKIREKVDVKANTLLNPKDLTQSARKIRKMYTDEGYYLAEVKGDVEKISDTEVKGVFTITEGKKILISRIRFEGNQAYTERKLKKTMETSEEWFLSWITGAGTYKEDVLKNDVALLADLYLNNGYINIKVGEPRVELLSDKSGLEVTIPISEGEQFRVGTIGFKGELLDTPDELRAKMKVKPGELFNRGTIRNDIIALTDLYADRGYAFANVAPLTKVDAAARTVDLTFDVEKGEKVTIERINIGGNLRTRDKVVRRELKLAEGDLYSSTAIKRSKQSLMNLGFFEDVNLATAPASKSDRLNLNVDVKEKATGTFSIGAGFSSLDGLIGQGSVQQANFLGLGLKANASVSLGGKSQTYNLGLTDPYFMDTRWTLGGDIYRTEREFINFKRRLTGGDIKAGYPLSDDVSTFWVYRLEKKDLLDIVGDPTGLEPHTVTSALQASITRNTTDYRLDPTRGMVNNFSTEFAGLGGDNRFLRLTADTTLFVPLMWSTVFSMKGTLGYIQEIASTEIPRDERFMPGGISSIRGYSPRTLGPILVNNIPPPNAGAVDENRRIDFLGGNKEAILNVEYVFPLIKEAGVKGVLFFDAGGAFGADRPEIKDAATQVFLPGRFQAGYGFGVRWLSPIGPLRLEYGIPVNPRTATVPDGKRRNIDEPGGRLEFSIGSMF